MDFKNQIELELYFADHFDTILFPVLADLYFEQDDLRRSRKVCEIGLKHHENDRAIKTASSTQARKPIYKTAICE